MQPLEIRDPGDHGVEVDHLIGDEFKSGQKWHLYAAFMKNIYQSTTPDEQTQNRAKLAREVIIPLLEECDDIKAQEEEDYVALFKKHHGPGNVREKHIAMAAELMSRLQEEDPALGLILQVHRPIIINEPHFNLFKCGKAMIQYHDGKYKDIAEGVPTPQSTAYQSTITVPTTIQDEGCAAIGSPPATNDAQHETLQLLCAKESAVPRADEIDVEELLFGIIDSLSSPPPPAEATRAPSASQQNAQLAPIPAAPHPAPSPANAAGGSRSLKLRGPALTAAEYEQRLAAYQTDFHSKRVRSDDDTEDESLWVPRKKIKISSVIPAAAPPAEQAESAADPEPEQSIAASAPATTGKSSATKVYPAEAEASQPAAASSSRPRKRIAEDMDENEDDQDDGAASPAKRQKIAAAVGAPAQHGTPSGTNLGFARKHAPIKATTLSKSLVTRRSWLFAHQSAQGLGVYAIKCPKKSCGHAFKEHPLLENRARDHFQACGFVFADDQEMLQECAQQGMFTSP